MNTDDLFRDSYIAFDLETSGFSPKRDDILQVGIIDIIEGSESGEETSFIVNPNFPNAYEVPRKITELTGLTSLEVSTKGLDPKMVIPMVAERLHVAYNVTHNGIAFDKPFFEAACRKYGVLAPWKGYWLDTAVIYKASKTDKLPMLGVYSTLAEFAVEVRRPIKGLKYNLAYCCWDYGIDISDLSMHRADSDCVATYRLYEQMKEDMMGM